MLKIKPDLSTPENRAYWAFVRKTKEEAAKPQIVPPLLQRLRGCGTLKDVDNTIDSEGGAHDR